MKILKTLGVTWLGFSLVAGLFIYDALALGPVEQTDQPYAYQVISQSSDIKLDPGAPGWLIATIRNIGQADWEVAQLRLDATYFEGTPGRISQFATSEWENGHLIKPATDQTVIKPLERVTFKIPVQAGSDLATFKESFRPVINNHYAEGETISYLIRVGDDIAMQSADENGKKIRISLDKQQLWAIENHVVVMSMPISSGKAGYGTPTGQYTIYNHIPKAYSAKYQLFMDNWMALAGPDSKKLKGYGIHKLPSWKVNSAKYKGMDGQYIGDRYYENGWIYEDAKHLGTKMSHGCMRVGVEEAPLLYDWAENGTVVSVS
ncbi:hypothetical protein A2810_01915 [candidate division Kazan bacterium RIFCSPHIGHO2_01_FULL_49_10]|uniref:L,D-TPase catalytic domain-containing protein n=1 Tax=candidate division Kazan bacterium RIFCSPLOWO2_01_FULL_48_13 TaxID=1798539 RepID=A0A1F4PMY3_UNCK3|nr:MAG: hypothetical protein A2810_01915 [candidate division Kazan bacterium RIFCSPHIGHO2_01_FULL_49_10]OGB85203.1 MAG: hypothetical protein A2994_03570 [candidate division Kazan bacterium RIFCSPLOWO2_01_FULL_48_13]